VSILQTRAQFTSKTSNNLNTGVNDLTLADSNQVGAQLLALQTRQSLSSTALSLATQADQNVLRLFR
jgi:flagellin-like hook-associated protein FlgL